MTFRVVRRSGTRERFAWTDESLTASATRVAKGSERQVAREPAGRPTFHKNSARVI